MLRSIPGCVLGPGLCYSRTGSSDQYIVYHAWDTNMEVRQMFLDRLIWMADGLLRTHLDAANYPAEVMCERVDETRLRINDEWLGIFLLTVDPLNLNASF